MTTVLFNSHDIVLLVVCYICFLFAIMTLLKRNKADASHIWLSLFLFSQAGVSAYILAFYGEAFHHWSVENIPVIFAILELALWIEGPLLLLYVRSALYQELKFIKHDLLLLLPCLFYIIVVVGAHISFESAEGLSFLLFLKSDFVQYYEHLRNIFQTSFGFWALFTLNYYQKSLSSAYSNPESVDYSWLKLLIIGFILLRIWAECYLLMFTLISEFLPNLSIIDFNILGIIGNYGQLLLVSTLLFFALSEPHNILRVNKEVIESITKTPKANTYSAEQVARVCSHMEKQRPFLDHQLKIDDLAKQVSLSPKLLSNLINREFKVNFLSLIHI